MNKEEMKILLTGFVKVMEKIFQKPSFKNLIRECIREEMKNVLLENTTTSSLATGSAQARIKSKSFAKEDIDEIVGDEISDFGDTVSKNKTEKICDEVGLKEALVKTATKFKQLPRNDVNEFPPALQDAVQKEAFEKLIVNNDLINKEMDD